MQVDYRDEIYVLGMRFQRLPNGKLRRIRGAGRPGRSPIYGEPTERVSVPVSLLPMLKRKMEALAVRYSAHREIVESDVLYTTPGYTVEDLDRAEDEGRARRWN